MPTVTSQDGTTIAYDKAGRGPPIVLVAGALSARLSWSGVELAEHLSPWFTVFNYDRRGRGDSGDTQPYAVAREIEDIEALVEAAGGSAFLFGHSSGAALVLETSLVLGNKIRKVAIYEVPYNDDPAAQRAWSQYIDQLTDLLAMERRGDAVALFLKYVGTPADQIEAIRRSSAWARLEKLAPTLAYDHTHLIGTTAVIPVAKLQRLDTPVLVMYGGSGHPFMRMTAEKVSDTLPHAGLRKLEGQKHEISPEAIVPPLVEFFLGP
ncbi:MAG: alpha/beta hydrolase [Actinobacteria bacterium]|nr:alpha/beta hydrolase [Actinomycetota bacterium]